MQPYQEASDQIVRQREAPEKFIKKAGLLGLSIAGGGAAINRVLPLLSKLIPPALAVKGLSKLDPRFGKFIQGSIDLGHTQEETLDFIRDKVENTPQEEPKAKALKKFKEHKKKKSLVEREEERFLKEYGIGSEAQPQQTQQNELVQQMQPQNNQQQPGSGQQALMAIMQRINQKLGG